MPGKPARRHDVDRKVLGGRLEGHEAVDARGNTVAYRLQFTREGWVDGEWVRFDHDPRAAEPHHVHIRVNTTTLSEAKVLEALPQVVAARDHLAEVLS